MVPSFQYNYQYSIYASSQFHFHIACHSFSYWFFIHAYHIFGDPDDADTKAEKDKLKAAIAENPDEVIEFFTKLAQTMYDKLHDRMGSTDYSSAFTVYNDKEMKKEYESYKTKIEEEQKKMNAYIDNWYSKFSKMETALAKMQSKSTAITGMLGGN